MTAGPPQASYDLTGTKDYAKKISEFFNETYAVTIHNLYINTVL